MSAPRFASDIWDHVPDHLREGLDAHLCDGRPVGGFLTAVLSDELTHAVARGDETSLSGLWGLMHFLVCEAPAGSWGSPAAVAAWRERGGLFGRPQGRESAPDSQPTT